MWRRGSDHFTRSAGKGCGRGEVTPHLPPPPPATPSRCSHLSITRLFCFITFTCSHRHHHCRRHHRCYRHALEKPGEGLCTDTPSPESGLDF
ncbi:hypothetical protein E2C01_058125 [Portunus trituberculatus]|uniref:Uncharacterized protein n=1 Tax=Portunus trituberculatus TaxID=210409 RepID=A0A5B7H2W7_PORTR|nr:hypothetical protein [Portunus trituberculatus]